MIEGIIIGSLIILCIVMMGYYIKSKRKISKFLVGVGSGIGSLLIVSYILENIGYDLSVNVISIIISGILGIPGVAVIVGVTIFL